MQGKYILITGASGGIGQAIATVLAQEGYSLYLHYNQNEQGIKGLLASLSKYKGEFIPIRANLAEPDGYHRIVEQVFSIDGIVHNCGISHYGLFLDLKEQVLNQLLSVHVTSPVLLTKTLLPKMLQKQSGNIILISSIWGQIGAACEVAYSTVKGAQISFVKALAKEVALNGIRVNAIAPGAVQTPMLSDFTNEELEELKAEIPMGRLAEPIEIARCVSFLLSNNSSYMTGQIVGVNGGWHI